jgi:hypothetical protein
MRTYFLEDFQHIFSQAPEHFTSPWNIVDDDMAVDLFYIVKSFGILSDVSKGEPEYLVFGSTPKERVVGFLNYIDKHKHPLLD